MSNIFRFVASALAVVVLSGTAWSGEVTVKGADKLQISGYTQARFEFQDQEDDALVNSSFFVKRSRVKFKADINDYTWAELQVDFASSKIIKDAFAGIKLHDQVTVRMGQFKKPFSQEELFSSSATPVIDRGRTNDLITGDLGYSGRDQGLMLSARDKDGRVQGWLGVFSGAGESEVSRGDQLGKAQGDGAFSSNRGKDFAARLAVIPDAKRRIQIAANFSAKSVGASYSDTILAVNHNSEMFYAFGGDAAFSHNSLTLYVEALAGDNFLADSATFSDTVSSFEARSFLGLHAAAFYTARIENSRMVTAIQPEVRMEMFDPDTDTDDDGSTLISAGLSLLFGKNVRWRNNVVIESFQASGVDSRTRFVSELMAKI